MIDVKLGNVTPVPEEDSLDDRRTHHRPGQATLTDLGLVLDRPADEVIE